MDLGLQLAIISNSDLFIVKVVVIDSSVPFGNFGFRKDSVIILNNHVSPKGVVKIIIIVIDNFPLRSDLSLKMMIGVEQSRTELAFARLYFITIIHSSC